MTDATVGYAHSINVYPDPQRPGRWIYSVMHRNGGQVVGAASEDEAWRRARAVLAFHNNHA